MVFAVATAVRHHPVIQSIKPKALIAAIRKEVNDNHLNYEAVLWAEWKCQLMEYLTYKEFLDNPLADIIPNVGGPLFGNAVWVSPLAKESVGQITLYYHDYHYQALIPLRKSN